MVWDYQRQEVSEYLFNIVLYTALTAGFAIRKIFTSLTKYREANSTTLKYLRLYNRLSFIDFMDVSRTYSKVRTGYNNVERHNKQHHRKVPLNSFYYFNVSNVYV